MIQTRYDLFCPIKSESDRITASAASDDLVACGESIASGLKNDRVPSGGKKKTDLDPRGNVTQ